MCQPNNGTHQQMPHHRGHQHQQQHAVQDTHPRSKCKSVGKYTTGRKEMGKRWAQMTQHVVWALYVFFFFFFTSYWHIFLQWTHPHCKCESVGHFYMTPTPAQTPTLDTQTPPSLTWVSGVLSSIIWQQTPPSLQTWVGEGFLYIYFNGMVPTLLVGLFYFILFLFWHTTNRGLRHICVLSPRYVFYIFLLTCSNTHHCEHLLAAVCN